MLFAVSLPQKLVGANLWHYDFAGHYLTRAFCVILKNRRYIRSLVYTSWAMIIMKNFTAAKMDRVFDEIYALLVTEHLYPGSADNICKWESPDWKNNDDSLGIEVTQAQNKHIGYTYNVMAKYLGASKKQIPANRLHNFRGGTIFSDGKLLAVSDSKGLVNGNRHVHLLLEHLETKLKKLNAPHFTVCTQNFLFEFGIGCFTEHDKLEFEEGIKSISAPYSHTFDKVIVHALDSVLCFSLGGGISIHTVPSQELTNLAVLYRNASKWEQGALFSIIREQALSQK